MIILKPCREPGCKNLANGVYCKEHTKEHSYINRNIKMYGHKWRKARANFLLSHIFCKECLRKGIETLATEVDHIEPHNGDTMVFWNQNNWQALCKSCHSKKTAKENGFIVPPHQ